TRRPCWPSAGWIRRRERPAGKPVKKTRRFNSAAFFNIKPPRQGHRQRLRDSASGGLSAAPGLEVALAPGLLLADAGLTLMARRRGSRTANEAGIIDAAQQ